MKIWTFYFKVNKAANLSHRESDGTAVDTYIAMDLSLEDGDLPTEDTPEKLITMFIDQINRGADLKFKKEWFTNIDKSEFIKNTDGRLDDGSQNSS